MRIALVATGGTIASRKTEGGLVANVSGAELLAALGTDRPPEGADLSVVDVGTRGSFALTLDDMHDIAQAALDECAAGADGVVVTHGTDSLEETAFLIDLLHDGEAPIVVTGAQRAFDHPEGDGPGNLALALATAARPDLRGRGVLVAFGGGVMPARGVRKVDTWELAAFANHARPEPDDAARSTLPDAKEHLSGMPLSRVAVVATVPGGAGDAVRDALVRKPAGIVFQALGIGNASLEDAAVVGEAVASGVPVLVTSRVQHGSVRPLYGHGGGMALAKAGAVFAGDLSTWQARVLLSVCAALTPGPAAAQQVAAWLAERDEEGIQADA